METIGIISAIALLPQGLGVRKRGIEVRPKIRSANVNHPSFFSYDFINPIPMKKRDKPTNKKKATEKKVCGTPVDSGNTPIPINAHELIIRIKVPVLPKGELKIPLFLMPIAKQMPRIPAIISPKLNRIEAMPCAAHIGLSPGEPPRSER
jgi:hypothetical protein